MIHRFKQIDKNLYRGSAPSIKDVFRLHKNIGIKKIISLDANAGYRIEDICKKLHIKHIIIPVNFWNLRNSLLRLLHHDMKKLLKEDGPVFIHCAQGKDRTGFLSALYRCWFQGYSFQDALKEAMSLGFGVGLPSEVVEKTIRFLSEACNHQKLDTNDSDDTIVDNVQSYKGNDGRGSYLDQAHQGSWAPQVSKTKQYPHDPVFLQNTNQSPTRNNINHVINPYIEVRETIDIPMVGLSDVSLGPGAASPINFYSGFTHED